MNAPAIFDDLTTLADATRGRMLLVLERQELTVSELCAVLQLPQSTVAPQPSGAVPHSEPVGHDVVGAHLQTFVAVSQAPSEQLPQSIEPPQVSG